MAEFAEVVKPIFVFAPGVIAGAERVVLAGLQALSDKGLKPEIIVIRESRLPLVADEFLKQVPSSCQTHVILAQGAFDLSLANQLDQILTQSSHNTVIHSHGFKALFYVQRMKMKFPHVHTFHGNTAHNLKVRFYEWLAFRLMRQCEVIVAVTESQKRQLGEQGIAATQIQVIENMLFLRDVERVRALRRKKFQSQVPLELLFVGRLSKEKGLLQFLKYFSKMSLRIKFRLTVAGSGSERQLAEQLVILNKLQGQVRFLGHVEDPSDLYASADVLIMPSEREGLPLTLIEALACGLPVIANAVGAIPELLKSGDNGFLIESSDEKNWEEGLARALIDRNHWHALTLACSQEIQARFSLENWATQTLKLYMDQKQNFNYKN